MARQQQQDDLSARPAAPEARGRLRHTRLFDLPLTLAYDSERLCSVVEDRLKARDPAPFLVTFVNPHAWMVAQRQQDHRQRLEAFDLVLPDGIAVVKAAQWLLERRRGPRRRDMPAQTPAERRRQDRREGTSAAPVRASFDASSLYLPIFALLNGMRKRLFIIGAAPGVAEQALMRMKREFPAIDYVGCLDGYGDRNEAIAAILAARPDMVLCGMGAPHQERLLLDLRQAGFAGMGFTCGGFIDQLAEAPRYYPAIIDRLELRWLWRLVKEPGRLWKRYLVDYAPFIGMTLKALLQRRLGALRHGRRQPVLADS